MNLQTLNPDRIFEHEEEKLDLLDLAPLCIDFYWHESKLVSWFNSLLCCACGRKEIAGKAGNVKTTDKTFVNNNKTRLVKDLVAS